jgi:plastocyanin
MKMRILIVAGALAAAGVGTAALAAGMSLVDQKALAFSVASLTVGKGTVVRFMNSDTTAHNILITGGGATVNGGLQQPGGDFKAPFVKPGVYQVTCGIHPKMKLAVTVQ